MKKLLLITLMASIVLVGCGKKNADEVKTTAAIEETTEILPTSEDVEPVEVSEDFKAHFNEIKVEDQVITLPVSLTDFEEAGFQVEEAQMNVVDKGETVIAECSWGPERKGNFDIHFQYNGSEESRDLTECEIVAFIWEADRAEDTDLAFYNDINKSSTREYVKSVMHEIFANENGAQYRASANETENEELCINFKNDKISSIELYSYIIDQNAK